MTKQNDLFLATLNALYKSGVFEDIILIGSWCHPEILRTLDFTPTHSYTTGYTKYVHPELELEF